MFPFGSFLTQIPLILFAAVYMLYFGACALNRNKAEQEVNAALPEIQKQDTATAAVNNSTLILAASSFHPITVDNEVPETLIPELQLSKERIFIPDKDLISVTHGYSLFGRPPPAI